MPFDRDYLQRLFGELRLKGVATQAGLTDEEIARVEREYGFRFPSDLRAFLEFALPISENFPNWRAGWIAKPMLDWTTAQNGKPTLLGHNLVPVREQLEWPSDGICFDIEQNKFWAKEWGEQPEELSVALELARKQIAGAPRLIPLFSHRYLPEEPCERGNPVFSVYQTDIIYYGSDLASYFANEFEIACPNWAAKEPREIRFWSTFTRL